MDEPCIKKGTARKRKLFRKCIELEFATQEEKDNFEGLFSEVKTKLKCNSNKAFLYLLLRNGEQYDDSQLDSHRAPKKRKSRSSSPKGQKNGSLGRQFPVASQATADVCEDSSNDQLNDGYHSIQPAQSCDEEIFLTCKTSLTILINKAFLEGARGNLCPSIVNLERRGHAVKLTYKSRGKLNDAVNRDELMYWKSSPYLGEQYYVNYR